MPFISERKLAIYFWKKICHVFLKENLSFISERKFVMKYWLPDVFLYENGLNSIFFYKHIPNYLVISFSRVWFFQIFWFLAQRCMTINTRMWRSPIFEKKFFWANLSQKTAKKRVFWTLWKTGSLIFSEFLHESRVSS